MTAAPLLVGCALHDGADIDACGCPALDNPGAIAYRGLLVEARAEIARLTAELAAARAEVDCGQDGPCAKAPGCARHWQERNRELVAELAAARAVTAGVCRYLDCAASDLLAVVTSLYETRARAISDATAARDAEWQKRIAPLRPNRTGDGCDSGDPIDWTFAALMLARIDVESDAHDEGHRAAMRDATAARGTVGGLLATAPVDLSGPAGSRWTNAIEWVDGETWFRIATGASADGSPTLVLSTWCDGGWGYEDENPMSIDACVYALPARLVPAAEADVDPSQRGPLAATATNLHPDGCHTADPTAPRDCTSDGHHECTSCARFDAAGRAAMGDDPIGGPHGPLPKGG